MDKNIMSVGINAVTNAVTGVSNAYGKNQERKLVEQTEKGKTNREILEVAKSITYTSMETNRRHPTLEDQKDNESFTKDISNTIKEIIANDTELSVEEKVKMLREEEERREQYIRRLKMMSTVKSIVFGIGNFTTMIAPELIACASKVTVTYMATDHFNKNKFGFEKNKSKKGATSKHHRPKETKKVRFIGSVS